MWKGRERQGAFVVVVLLAGWSKPDSLVRVPSLSFFRPRGKEKAGGGAFNKKQKDEDIEMYAM